MRYTTTIFYIILMFCQSCSHHNQLQSNKTFNEQETKELMELLHKFDAEICHIEHVDDKQIFDCYQSFFERMEKCIIDPSLKSGISETAYQQIVETLSPNLRDEIWIRGISIEQQKIPNSDSQEIFRDTFPSTIVNTQGKYFQYLQNEVAKIDFRIEGYVEYLDRAGCIAPNLVVDVFKNHSQYNIKDEGVRLLLAIHYLTLKSHEIEAKAFNERVEKRKTISIKNESL